MNAHSLSLAPHDGLLADGGGTVSAVGWSLIVLVIAVVALAGILRLRRWMKEDDVSSGGVGFTISDLRRLQREGKITEEEFERARAKIVDAGRALAQSLPHPLAGRRQPPPPSDLHQSPPPPS